MFTMGEEGPLFGEKGAVAVTCLGQEMEHGMLADQYQLAGPGLSPVPAYCRVHPQGQYFLAVRVPVPDEPGFDNFLLQWRGSALLTETEWWTWAQERAGG
jgi:hypothetical protein